MAVGGQRLTFSVYNDELITLVDEKLNMGNTTDDRYVIKASKWRALKPTFLSTNSPFVNADNEIYTGPNNYLTTLVFRVWCGITQSINYTDNSKQTINSRGPWYCMHYADYKKFLKYFDNGITVESGNGHNYYWFHIPANIKSDMLRNNIGDLPTGLIPEGMTPDNFIGGYFDNGIPIKKYSLLDENLIYIANKCNVIDCSTFFPDDSGREDDYGNTPFKFRNYFNGDCFSNQVNLPNPPYIKSFSNIIYTPTINQIAEVDRPTMVQSYRGLYQRILMLDDISVNSSESYCSVIEWCSIVAKYDSSQIGGDTSGEQDNSTV